MEFAKRMDMFSEGIFSLLGERKKVQMNMGKRVVDLSIGAPNIPPADHVIETLHREVLNKENYVYALNDLDELQDAVAEWYKLSLIHIYIAADRQRISGCFGFVLYYDQR